MATSSKTTEKPCSKISQVLPTNYHLPERQYYGCVRIGASNYYTPCYETVSEAALELRCLEKNLSFELIKTIEEEGCYPERAILIEELYQQSGRTDCLYTGLSTSNGQILNDAA